MKRIITYLIVLLITLPAIGQINQEDQQLPERFKKHKIIDAFKEVKRLKNKKHNAVINDFNKSLKLNKAVDKKTLDSLVELQWDDNLNVWYKESKEEFTYDTNENVNLFINSMWNHSDLDWDLILKFEFTIDLNRNLTVLLNYWWNPLLNQWVLYTKNEYEYNTSNNPILETTFVWDTNNLQWDQTYKTEYTYDSSQNMIVETGFEWFPAQNQWFYVYKDELGYDISNNLILENNFYWNYDTSEWYSWSKWEYDYDTGNHLISEISFDWDGNQWVNNQKYEYTYSISGQLIVDIGFDWNSGNSQWIYVYKDEYVYDSNGNRTLGNYYEWLPTPGEWFNFYYDEFIFDLAFNMDDIIVPILYLDLIGVGFGDIKVEFSNMVIGYRGYENSGGMWVDSSNVLFYYSNYTNPLKIEDEILAKSLKVYPNPVSQTLTINSEIPLTKVEVYSILGKKVKEINEDFYSIQLNDLASGVYILKLASKSGNATMKLIKK